MKQILIALALVSLGAPLQGCNGNNIRSAAAFFPDQTSDEISIGLPRYTPRDISIHRSDLSGQRLLVEGYLYSFCNPRSDACAATSRFGIMGGSLNASADNLGCTTDGLAFVPLEESLPTGFGIPQYRRALVSGTVANRTEIVSVQIGSSIALEPEYDIVLEDVVIVALYEEKCAVFDR